MPSIRESLSRFRERTRTADVTFPRRSDTPLPALTYSAADWEEECLAAFGEGRDPEACPDCGRTGFYGPRVDATERHYRQCRFCGFTQMVGEAPCRYQPTVHQCDDWPECARAPYIWWLAPEVESFLCPFCSKRMRVGEALVTPPVHDPEHPWWKVPQDRARFYYSRFWENWGVTSGRVYL